MENNLDRLFRNKLSDHKVTPSNESWEKLNSQLSQARWSRAQKRLAIAASVLLFMSLIGVAYNYLDTHKSVENSVVSEKVESASGNSEMTEPQPEPQLALNNAKEVNGAEASVSENQPMQIIDAGQKKKHSEHMQDKTEYPAANSTTSPENVTETPLLAQLVMESTDNSTVASLETAAESAVTNSPAEIHSSPEPMTVTITYKANKNSRLVASQRNNIIQEGIEKITGFAEERVFTDELKTKLRNTTGDVLALNFGKLINKQNKEN